MEETKVKSFDLENGLKLELFDVSRKIAVDRWFVQLLARIIIPVDAFLHELESSFSVDEIKKELKESVLFEKKMERNFIDEKEKDALFNDMRDSFIDTSLSYISRPEFPIRYLIKTLNEKMKHKSGRGV